MQGAAQDVVERMSADLLFAAWVTLHTVLIVEAACLVNAAVDAVMGERQ